MSEDRVDDITIDGDLFRVLMNDEEQYSIWPAGAAIPAGWRSVCDAGTKDACLAYVEEHWTDMRPKSLRVAMDG